MNALYEQRIILVPCVIALLHLARLAGYLTVLRFTGSLAALAAVSAGVDFLTHRITPLTLLTLLAALWLTIDTRQRHRRTTRLSDMARHI
ncbi:MAG TPA: hypothetical protein VIM84_11315 [Gemmatimonadales bacterium]